MLSSYCVNTANKCDITIGGIIKLVPNLGNRDKYVPHYKNLQLYLAYLPLGMKLVSVHRILKFRQFDWLKKYIDFNTDKRKHATNSSEKDFFKLMNNSVYNKQWKIKGKE